MVAKSVLAFAGILQYEPGEFLGSTANSTAKSAAKLDYVCQK
jgi:hypothetical protein